MRNFCPNLSNPKIKQQFQELIDATNENIAYNLWNLNNGHPLDYAPNGKESKLFIDLLSSCNGDRKLAIIAKAKVYTSSFINWFGDWINDPVNASKVVDENGEPLVVYHRSNTSGFTIFNLNNSTKSREQLFSYAYHTGTKKAAEEVETYGSKDSSIFELFVNIKHPAKLTEFTQGQAIRTLTDFIGHSAKRIYGKQLPIELFNKYRDKVSMDNSPEEVRVAMKEVFDYMGFDGYYYTNEVEDPRSTSWAALNPNQLKSATDNVGSFSRENDNIYMENIIDLGYSQDRDSRLETLFKSGKQESRGVVGASVLDIINMIEDSQYSSIIELLKTKFGNREEKLLKGLKVKLVNPFSFLHIYDDDKFKAFGFAGRRAFYDAADKTIYIDVIASYSEGNSSGVLLHEIMHAITVDRIISNPEAKAKFEQILKDYQNSNFDPRYREGANHPLEEFIANIWSDPVTIENLKKIKSSRVEQSLWDEIKEFFNNLFSGIFKGTASDSLMAEASVEMIKLLESPVIIQSEEIFKENLNTETKTIEYTPAGKERLTYTIIGNRIYNKKGKEVFKGEGVDRNKIFGNLAVKEGRAVVVTYRDAKYVVNNKNVIMSVSPGKIMQWDEENGDRKKILSLAQTEFNRRDNLNKDQLTEEVSHRPTVNYQLKENINNKDFIKLESGAIKEINDTVKNKLIEFRDAGKTFILKQSDPNFYNFLSILQSIGAKYKIYGSKADGNTMPTVTSINELSSNLDIRPITKKLLREINEKLFKKNPAFVLVEHLHYRINKEGKVVLNSVLKDIIESFKTYDDFKGTIANLKQSFQNKFESLSSATLEFIKSKMSGDNDIERYLLLSSLVRNNMFQLTTKGIYLHPGDTVTDASNKLSKRNGSSITTLEIPTVCKNGVPPQMKLVIFDTISKEVANALGQIETLDVWDGAVFENGIMDILMSNSFNKKYKGTKKPLGMFKVGNNQITMKCSTVTLSNWRVRLSANHKNGISLHNMLEKMLGLEVANLMEMLNLNYETPVSTSNGFVYKRIGAKYYQCSGFVQTDEGVQLQLTEVDEFGEIQYKSVTEESIIYEPVVLNSVADIWKLFGAENSYSLIDGQLVLSEASLELTSKFVINCVDNNGKQILKDAMIHYAADSSAIKNGISNQVSLDALVDPNSKSLMYTVVQTQDMGILLDANHAADDSEISSLSLALVLIAQNADGIGRSKEVWEGLRRLMHLNLNKVMANNLAKSLSECITKLLYKLIKSNQEFGSELAILTAVKDSGLPVNDNNLYDQVLKIAFQTINDAALRLKYQGLPGILNPSMGIMITYRLGNNIYTPLALTKKGLDLVKSSEVLSKSAQTQTLTDADFLTIAILNHTKPETSSLEDALFTLNNSSHTNLHAFCEGLRNYWNDNNFKGRVEEVEAGSLTFYDTIVIDGLEVYLDTIEKLQKALSLPSTVLKSLTSPSDLKPMNITWREGGVLKSMWNHPVLYFLQRLSKNTLTTEDQKIVNDLEIKFGILTETPIKKKDKIRQELLRYLMSRLEAGFSPNFSSVENFYNLNLEQAIDKYSFKQTYAECILPKVFAERYDLKNKNLNEITRDHFDEGEEGDKKYASFLKLKQLLATRIPSDGLHSMMTMTCAGYTDDPSNNVGVCIWLLWLQGSDLDIDKAYMLMYEPDENGIILGWSPLFNYTSEEHLDASLDLPLPQSFYYDIKKSEVPNKFDNLVQEYMNLNEGHPQQIRILGEMLRFLASGDGLVSITVPDEILILLQNKINMHVKGYEKLSTALLSNFVAHNLMKISSDPKCIMQSLSIIEMSRFRDPVNKRAKADQSKPTTDYDDGISILEVIYQNLVGKDGVGITANGGKGMTAVDVAYLEFGEELFKNRGIYIDGNHANIVEKYRQAISKDLNQTALLNSATDNAKELILEKIKGDRNFLSLIILLNSMGFSPEEIVGFTDSEEFKYIYRAIKTDVYSTNKITQSSDHIYKIIQECIENPPVGDRIIYETIKWVYSAALEFSMIPKMMINGGIKNAKDSELSTAFSKFTNPYMLIVINKLYKKEGKKRVLRNLGEIKELLSAQYIDKEDLESRLNKWFNDWKDSSFIKSSGDEELDLIKYASLNIRMDDYFSNVKYREFIQDTCDLFCNFINPYKVLNTLPIYFTIWEIIARAIDAVKNTVDKFNFAVETGPDILKSVQKGEIDILEIQDKPWIIKNKFKISNCRRWYDLKLVFDFLKENVEDFGIIPNVKGISHFIDFVVSQVIPALDELDEAKPFIQSIAITNNLNHYDIQFRNISDTKYSENKVKWTNILYAFNSLDKDSVNYKNSEGKSVTLNIHDVFFLANLILNQNKPGGKRLTPLFKGTVYYSGNIDQSNSKIGNRWLEFAKNYKLPLLDNTDILNLVGFITLFKLSKLSLAEDKTLSIPQDDPVYLFPSISAEEFNNNFVEKVDGLIELVDDILEFSNFSEDENFDDLEGNADEVVAIPTVFTSVKDNLKHSTKSENNDALLNILENLKSFGIEVNFNPDILHNGQKAGLSGDVIYINKDTASIDDYVHEWLHFLFGVVKMRNPEAYFSDVLGKFANTLFANNIIDQLKRQREYVDLTDSDLLEEALIRTIVGITTNTMKGEDVLVDIFTNVKQLFIDMGIMKSDQKLFPFLQSTFKDIVFTKTPENKNFLEQITKDSVIGQQIAMVLSDKNKYEKVKC